MHIAMYLWKFDASEAHFCCRLKMMLNHSSGMAHAHRICITRTVEKHTREASSPADERPTKVDETVEYETALL